MARRGALRFASAQLGRVRYGSVRFGSARFWELGSGSSVWAGFAAQLLAATSGSQCAFNNKFNCLLDVGKVQRRGARSGVQGAGRG